jgi:metal transporter CNNM
LRQGVHCFVNYGFKLLISNFHLPTVAYGQHPCTIYAKSATILDLVGHYLLTIEVLLLVCLSAICSGLNIAIMSLDLADLNRKAKLGNGYAKLLLPLRRNHHLTLASILLVNVGVVSANSLVLESHMNGVLAGLLSTILIVIFGEITPQALFSRNPLKYCGIFAPALRLMIILTYPIAKPLQLLLDKLFGPAETHVQTRRELGMLISEHLTDEESELDEDEVEIMRGALQLSEKHVHDIVTPINKTYWLTPDTIIDAQKIDEIKAFGYSRIPVFDKALTQCYGVLLMKDMVDIDFDERSYRADELPLHQSELIGSKTALDTMFRKFIGAHTHLLPIERNDKIIGVVTIEDLIEEILGHEIRDETDHAFKRA